MSIARRLRRALVVGLLAGTAACDWFVNPTTTDPNAIPNASIDQLFVSIQINTWFLAEGTYSRLTSVWMQQMVGVERQFNQYNQYIITQEDADEVFNALYVGGGLVDIVKALATPRASTDRIYAGIIKVHEAFVLQVGASAYGDIPFSEAVSEVREPVLDPQVEVYEAALALLDEAIADLQSGAGPGPGSVDMAFGGNADRWVAVANTLKARIHSHLAEVQPGRYAQVLAAATAGINTSAGNWRARHSDLATEQNPWFMFQRDRSGYVGAGAFLVDLMKARDDPRLAKYFSPLDGEIVGHGPETPAAASELNEAAGSPGNSAFAFPILTCEENFFLAAEAASQTGDNAGAASNLQKAIDCSEAFWGVTLPDAPAAPTLEEIITQKYMALFLNYDVWNTYKRTCLPDIPTFQGQAMIARLLYSDDEEETNRNIPPASQQPVRNANDPQGC